PPRIGVKSVGQMGGVAAGDADHASGDRPSKTEGVHQFTPVVSMLCEHRAVEALARETEGRVMPNPAIELAGGSAHDGAPVRVRADAKAWIYGIIHGDIPWSARE
ncbi:MAG: hypothetical protein J0H80_11140, partial [Rhizobiales bacterium]|nr:hypothetical protein [Hyphomicrobiales bacterium]